MVHHHMVVGSGACKLLWQGIPDLSLICRRCDRKRSMSEVGGSCGMLLASGSDIGGELGGGHAPKHNHKILFIFL